MMADPGPSIEELEKDGQEAAKQAVEYDTLGKIDAAIYFYTEACQSLLAARKFGSKMPGLEDKAKQYIERAEELTRIRFSLSQRNPKTQQQLDLEKAEFLVVQGFEEDEQGNNEDAAELYMQATELCLKTKSSTGDKDLQTKLGKLASQALERAEILKNVDKKGTTASPRQLVKPLGSLLRETSPNRLSPKPQTSLQVSGASTYTKEEVRVLRQTSIINGREYVPFMQVDLKERFAFPVTFSDKDGKLSLSPKQRSRFAQWVRPEEFCEHPTMIERIDSITIKQTVVSDCSFVASLAISSLYERRFKKKLITSIIFPQNRHGQPLYNPCGKYMIKLIINGVPRKVVIDDCLPMSRHGELLCSFSTNRNELWISLMEKAYMKVMGGYDFPGSNSNIDLHCLTGWIPERVAIRLGTAEFNKTNLFQKLLERFHRGDVLVTVATGDMSENQADRAGLVPTHAYALLDIRLVSGKELIMLKNPWSHLRWKGNYSEKDTRHWTPELKKALKYDPKDAQQFDDGVFWIDYESMCQFFDVIYMNWNPSLFKFTYCLHETWTARGGPVKDQYSLGENPQYRLEVNNSTGTAAVWVLLTRHITDKDDFAENKVFLAVLVYKSKGRKVYYPFDPAPYIDGVRINSPHYLCKMVLNNPGTNLFTLVVSEYEKVSNIHFTLRVYSTVDFKLSGIQDKYAHVKKVEDGQWRRQTAGGCANNQATYHNNPCYQLHLEGGEKNDMYVELKGPKQYSVGFDVTAVSSDYNVGFSRISSGDFRHGFTYLELHDIPAGVYNIVPCTFNPGQEGPFFLTIKSTSHIKLSHIR